MKIISEEEVDEVKPIESPKSILKVDDDAFKRLLAQMENPLNVQKELAAKIKQHLDQRIEEDEVEYGKITESTRKWIMEYNSMLSTIHRQAFGDKTVTEIKVSHQHIAQKVRQATKIIDVEV